MALVRIPALALAALLSAASLAALATPFSVRLGAEKIVLDTPPGFTDTGDLASPRLNDLAATLTSPSNRILIFALADSDFRKFTQGEFLDMRRYLIAVTPKGLENVRVGQEQFAGLVSDALRDLGRPATVTEYVKYLESQPIGKASLLEELKREPGAFSVLQGTRLPPMQGEKFWQSDKPQYLYFTTTLLLVRGRALRIDVYTVSFGAPELDWLKSTTERWVQELQRLNK
jgi:hypothetical protein